MDPTECKSFSDKLLRVFSVVLDALRATPQLTEALSSVSFLECEWSL